MQGKQAVWEIDHQHVRFFVYGVWLQGGYSVEAAGSVAEDAIHLLLNEGRVEIDIQGQLYILESV
jgi:hypothetical protein